MPAHVAEAAAAEAAAAAEHGARLCELLAPLDPQLEPRALTEFRQALATASASFASAARLLGDQR